MNKNACCSASFSAFGIISVLDFCHCSKCASVYRSYSPLNMYGVERFFMRLLAMCVSSLVRCLLKSFAHVSIKLFITPPPSFAEIYLTYKFKAYNMVI